MLARLSPVLPMACPQLGLGEIVPRTVATRESLEGLTPEKAQPKPKPLGLGAQPSSLGRAKPVFFQERDPAIQKQGVHASYFVWQSVSGMYDGAADLTDYWHI